MKSDVEKNTAEIS